MAGGSAAAAPVATAFVIECMFFPLFEVRRWKVGLRSPPVEARRAGLGATAPRAWRLGRQVDRTDRSGR